MDQVSVHKLPSSKRKRYLRVFLIVLLIVIGICAVTLAAGIYALGEPYRVIKRDPVMSVIHSKGGAWDTRRDLIPDVFNEGDSVSSVSEVLSASKFSPGYYKSYFSKEVVDSDTMVWTRRYGTFVCNMEWAVFLKFNADKKLISADGTVGERGCL